MVTLLRACHLSWANAAVAQCLVPGLSMTFRSRVTPFGQSSRNEAIELATPLSVALSLGRPVPDELNVKLPREPPLSCVCSRMSRFLRHSPPNLNVWLCISLVSVPATFHVCSERSHGWLAENPSTGPE